MNRVRAKIHGESRLRTKSVNCGDRTVDVHIRRLRSKLDESDCIETVRNIGYRFRGDD